MLNKLDSIKVAFLDRDGVINIDYGHVHSTENFVFIPGVFDACFELQEAGYSLIIVTNQSGIGRGLYDEKDFFVLSDWMKRKFLEHRVKISDIYFCPHHPNQARFPYRKICSCRKPEPGMLLAAKKKWNIDMSNSIMVGDKQSDMVAAMRAQVGRRILVGTNGYKMPEAVTECTDTAQNLLEAVNLFLHLTA